MKKKILSILISIFLITTVVLSGCSAQSDEYAYLFVYFTGNEDTSNLFNIAPWHLRDMGIDPEELIEKFGKRQEAVYYALSMDGYRYSELNKGEPILISESGTGGIRDPFIFKDNDGNYVMLATDMHARYGWTSNTGIITWRSTDLINWTDETIIEILGHYDILENSYCAWAPQAIYDSEYGQYMIYFTAGHPDSDDGHWKCIYYAYTEDFKTLTTEPQVLYEEPHIIIDADIIYANGKYYMFYKTDVTGGIDVVSSTTLTGTYGNHRQVITIGCEGSNVFKLIGKNEYVIMADIFWADDHKGLWLNWGYTFTTTKNFNKFKEVRYNKVSFNFRPRHGYVITINKSEYDDIMAKWGEGVVL